MFEALLNTIRDVPKEHCGTTLLPLSVCEGAIRLRGFPHSVIWAELKVVYQHDIDEGR